MNDPSVKGMPANELNGFVWQALPDMVGKKYSAPAGKILADGSYLSTIIKRSYLLLPLLFFIGLLIGANHFWFEKPPYNDSLTYTIVIILLALSIWGSCFGFWLLAGFAIGDLFIYSYQNFLRGGFYVDANSFFSQLITFTTHYLLPKLILIALLYSLLVMMPPVANRLRQKITGMGNQGSIDKILLNIVLYSALCGLLTYCWTKSVPTLISPIYNWIYPTGTSMHCPPPMSQDIFINHMKIVWAAVILGFARYYVEFIYAKRSVKMPDTYALPLVFAPKTAFSAKWIIMLLLGSAFSVLMLTGLMLKGTDDNYVSEAWHLGWLSLGVASLLNVARKILVTKGDKWIALLQKVPFFIRLVIVLLLSYYVSKYFINSYIVATDTAIRVEYMRAMIYAIFSSIAIMYILLPDINDMASRKFQPAAAGGNRNVLRSVVLLIFVFSSSMAFAGTFCLIDPNVHGDDPGGEIPITTTAVGLTLALAASGVLKSSGDGSSNILVTIDPAHAAGSIDAMASGGTEPYTYEWKNNKTGEVTSGTNISNLKAGDEYTVTVTDADGKSVSGTATVVDDKGINQSDPGADSNVSL